MALLSSSIVADLSDDTAGDDRSVRAGASPLVFSTFLGGPGEDWAHCVAVGPDGSLYVAGYSGGTFPTTDGAFQRNPQGQEDIVVAKLSSDGSVLEWSTRVGGSGRDIAWDLALGPGGRVYVTGQTASDDFPTTFGAISDMRDGDTDAFVLCLGSNGTELVYSTYLGGESNEWGNSINARPDGSAYVAGHTESWLFPTTTGAWDRGLDGFSDTFVARISANGGSLLASTFLGGGYTELEPVMALGASGDIWVAGSTTSTDFPITAGVYGGVAAPGRDVFVSVLDSGLGTLVHSTFFGGSGNDVPRSIDVDVGLGVLVGGFTTSPDLPTTDDALSRELGGGTDGFVLTMSTSLSTLTYSSLLGGKSFDVVRTVLATTTGSILMTGYSNSTDFPTTPDALQPSKSRDDHDVFFAVLPPSGEAMEYSTFLGDDAGDFGMDMVLDPHGVPVIVGHTRSSSFPVAGKPQDMTYNGGGDMFALRLSTDVEPPEFISDGSDYEPQTGEDFTFRATVRDATEISLVLVSYRFDGDEPTLAEMLANGEDYHLTVAIDPGARTLHYRFSAVDVLGKANETDERSLPVLDVISPEVVQVLTLGGASTGDRISLAAIIRDNIVLRAAYVEYETADGDGNTTMVPQSEPWPEGSLAYNITVPKTSVEPVRYRFAMVDDAGNWNDTVWFEVIVEDSIPPTLGDIVLPVTVLSGTTLSFNVSASDNIGIASARLSWGPGGGTELYNPLPPLEPFIMVEVTIGKDWTLAEYTFSLVAFDAQGLAAHSQATTTVVDTPPPDIINVVYPSTVATGGSVEISFEIEHEVPLEDTWVLYRFGETDPVEWRPEELDQGTFTLTIPPDSTEPLVFEIWTRDVRGNTDFSWETIIEVRDEEPPVAEAGLDITVSKGEEFYLVAEGSTDNIGIANYTWYIQISELEVVRELYGLSVMTSLPNPGVYEVTLVVTDFQGNEDTDTLRITVEGDGAEEGLTVWEVAWVAIPLVVATGAIGVWYTRRRSR